MAGWGDVNADGDNDVVIGDPRHLNFDGDDWANNVGICYALYNIGEPGVVGRTELDLDAPGTMATVARITADWSARAAGARRAGRRSASVTSAAGRASFLGAQVSRRPARPLPAFCCCRAKTATTTLAAR